MKRGIIVAVILLLLLAMGIVELYATNKITNELRTELSQLAVLLNDSENNTSSLEPKFLDFKESWTEKKFYLCLMFNRQNFSSITEHINVLHSYIVLDEYSDAYVQLQLLDLILKESKKCLYFSFENVI